MNSHRLFPDVSFSEWIGLWKCGYAEEYGTDDDDLYFGLMKKVYSAKDFAELSPALEALFEWKDRLRNRWQDKLKSIRSEDWERFKAEKTVPSLWDNGIVYNVFLWHVATNGEKPLIDQHAWRGYCYLTGRSQRPEFPSYRSTALKFYAEYDEWFQTMVSTGNKARDLDKALMSFGQFCSGQFSSVIEYYQSRGGGVFQLSGGST
jgi:hypothetical protein